MATKLGRKDIPLKKPGTNNGRPSQPKMVLLNVLKYTMFYKNMIFIFIKNQWNIIENEFSLNHVENSKLPRFQCSNFLKNVYFDKIFVIYFSADPKK